MDKNTLLIRLSESARTDFGRIPFESQSDPQKVFSSLWDLESHVNNGGFDSYLRYVDSDVIAYAPAALEAIGALACRAIVHKALILLKSLPPTRDEREDALDSLGEADLTKLETLDEEFYKYPDDLTDLLYNFVAARPDTFGEVP